MKHDATTGFNDIKALPQFTPPSVLEWLPVIAALIFAIGIAYLVYSKLKAYKTPKQPPISAKDRAISEIQTLLNSLKNNNISLREYSSEVSLAFRGFLQDLLDIPAKDQTTRELFSVIAPELEKIKPSANEQDIEQLYQRTTKVLRTFEGITFKRHTEAVENATSTTEEAKKLIDELAAEEMQ